jgi:hypothetical protein
MDLQRMLDEIRCEFRPFRKGKRTLQVLSSVTFVPQIGDPVKYKGTPGHDAGLIQALTRVYRVAV